MEQTSIKEKFIMLGARSPEHIAMRKFAESLREVQFPDVKSPEMVALVRDVGVELSDIHIYIYDNTQDTV